ncbi:MAG: hypothetical protein RL885_18605 [Planctomycetota bacterium]
MPNRDSMWAGAGLGVGGAILGAVLTATLLSKEPAPVPSATDPSVHSAISALRDDLERLRGELVQAESQALPPVPRAEKVQSEELPSSEMLPELDARLTHIEETLAELAQRIGATGTQKELVKRPTNEAALERAFEPIRLSGEWKDRGGGMRQWVATPEAYSTFALSHCGLTAAELVARYGRPTTTSDDRWRYLLPADRSNGEAREVEFRFSQGAVVGAIPTHLFSGR